jgi:hypothetical protein
MGGTSRMRIGRVVVLCLGLAALLPAQASAAGRYIGTYKNAACTATGGSHGAGKVSATAGFQETGISGTNYFRTIATVQKRKDGRWSDWSPSSKAKSNVFNDDALTHVWDYGWEYNFLASEASGTFRLKFVYEFWDQKDGPDARLAKLTKYGPAC